MTNIYKTNSRILSLALTLTAVLFTSASCEVMPFREYTQIEFSANSTYSFRTKTSYSGDISTDGVERIDWLSGDRIRVFCPVVSEPHCLYADYKTSSVGTANGTTSSSKIELVDLIGLRWGPENRDHVFYAVYPSPSTKEGRTIFGKDDGLDGTFTGMIPASQPGIGISRSGNVITSSPDMTLQYMAARRTIPAGSREKGDVLLSFTPITTAIEITLTNDYTEDDGVLNISSVSLISDNDISGSFKASFGNWDGEYPECTGTGTCGKIVAQPFTEVVSLSKGESLILTLFLMPLTDINDLSLRIDREDGGYVSTKLAYADGTGVTFPAFKKNRLSGILVPEGAQWTLKYDGITVSTWSTVSSTISIVQ